MADMPTHRMFYRNQCARSPRYGMGIVVRGGWNPTVQFLDGPLLDVMGRTLKIIPDQVYDAEVMNRTQIERWLDWRIHGVVQPAVRMFPRPRVDLLVGLKEALDSLPVRVAENDSSGVFWFTAEELNHQPDDHGEAILPIVYTS